jgi:hypothetical protein
MIASSQSHHDSRAVQQMVQGLQDPHHDMNMNTDGAHAMAPSRLEHWLHTLPHLVASQNHSTQATWQCATTRKGQPTQNP